MNDPKTYRAMREPHADYEAASKTIAEFRAGVADLRRKCRIADVYCLVGVQYCDGDNEHQIIGRVHFGDGNNVHVLAAYGYGLETSDHEHMIQSTISEAKRDRKGSQK